MGGAYLIQAAVFLIELGLGLYCLVLILYLLLRQVRADFYHPVSQLVIRLTAPPLRLLRRVIPSYLGIDCPALLLLLVVQGVEICLIGWLLIGQPPALAGLPVLILAHIARSIIYLYLFIILAQVILSWLAPHAYHHPMARLLRQLSDPVLRPFRRWGALGDMDWSPFFALVVMNLILILVVAPLMDLGNRLAGFALRLL